MSVYSRIKTLLLGVKLLTWSGEYDNGNSGSAITLNWNNGNFQTVTLTDDVTFTFTDPAIGIGRFDLRIVQDATAGRDITWPGNVEWPEIEPDWTTGTNGEQSVITLRYDGTNYVAIPTSYF